MNRTSAVIRNPENISISITMTLTVAAWLELVEQLEERWPSWDLAREITSVVRQIQTTVYPKEEK